MTKVKQKIILFINQSESFERSTSICNLYMNRFTIDEDAGHETVKIYEIEEFNKIFERKETIGMVCSMNLRDSSRRF